MRFPEDSNFDGLEKFCYKRLVFVVTLEPEIWCDEVLINLNKAKIKSRQQRCQQKQTRRNLVY